MRIDLKSWTVWNVQQHKEKSTWSSKTHHVVSTGGVAAGGRGRGLPGGSCSGPGSWPGFEEIPAPSGGGGGVLAVLGKALRRDSEQGPPLLLLLRLPGGQGLLHQLQTRLPQWGAGGGAERGWAGSINLYVFQMYHLYFHNAFLSRCCGAVWRYYLALAILAVLSKLWEKTSSYLDTVKDIFYHVRLHGCKMLLRLKQTWLCITSNDQSVKKRV